MIRFLFMLSTLEENLTSLKEIAVSLFNLTKYLLNVLLSGLITMFIAFGNSFFMMSNYDFKHCFGITAFGDWTLLGIL